MRARALECGGATGRGAVARDGQLGLGDDAYRVNPTVVEGINKIMEDFPGYSARAGENGRG